MILVSVGSDGNVFVWDIQAQKIVSEYPSAGNVFLSCAGNSKRNLVCITDIAGKLHWLVLEDHQCLQGVNDGR
jgi:hypothetical protein